MVALGVVVRVKVGRDRICVEFPDDGHEIRVALRVGSYIDSHRVRMGAGVVVGVGDGREVGPDVLAGRDDGLRVGAGHISPISDHNVVLVISHPQFGVTVSKSEHVIPLAGHQHEHEALVSRVRDGTAVDAKQELLYLLNHMNDPDRFVAGANLYDSYIR
jgi:hypothetical protein